MEKYILQILENNSRVIVPEFGAFIIKQKNPLIVVFNEFLQYNDGVLVDTVAKNEGTDRDSAKKKIDEFVKSILSQLDRGNPFVIEQLGALVKNASGKISLDKDSAGKTGKTAGMKKDDKKPEAPKKGVKEPEKPAEDIKKESEVKASPIETKTENDEISVELEDETAEKNIKEKEAPEESKEDKKQEKKAEPKPQAKEPASTPVADTSSKTEKSEAQVQANDPKKHTVYRTTASGTIEPRVRRSDVYAPRSARSPQKSGKKTNLWLWVIVILIINGIIITYFIMSDQLSGLFKKTEEISAPAYDDMTIDSEEDKTDEMLLVEPEDKTLEQEPVQPAPVKQPLVTGKRYYIVAGVFREEQNADNLVVELRNKGYNAEKFGKIGNLHAVSFGVYTSKTDAEREMQRIKKEVNPEAWIKVMQ